MPPRSSWKGFLKLSLVSVPVKAYTANVSGGEIRLNQLHRDCHNRVKYQKSCPEHGELKAEDIVSGYEYAKGQYVIVDADEVDKLRRESDRSVQIDGFIRPDEVGSIYETGKTYFLLPDGAVGQKPYALLRQVMQDSELVAVAQIVLSGKEQVVLLRPVDDVLAMTVLHFSSRVKSPQSFSDELTETELDDAELQLTKTLIDASRISDFDFTKYTDEYTDKLRQVIEAKIAGEEIVAVPDHEEPKILNLMEALKQSVAASVGQAESEVDTEARPAKASKKRTTKKKTARKMAPSAKAKPATRAKKATRKRKSG